jgi:ABC-2 type transport system ATP-binding protein
MSQEPAVRTEGLTKQYGAHRAVAGLDLTVPAGSIFGFLGPNGAGKTTTIGMLSTVVRPTTGTAEVAGADVRSQPDQVRRRIGLVFQESTLDIDLSAEENLLLYGELFGLPRARLRQRIDELLELVGLISRRGQSVRQFSAGMRRQLEMARGLMHAPRVLFLDEPTTGLDPQTRAAVWQQLHELRATRHVTVFLTTHHLEEAEHCDQLAIMDHGRLVAEGDPAGLKALIGDDLVTVRTEDNQAAAVTIRERFGTAVRSGPDEVSLRVPNGAAFVPRLCAALTVPVHAVAVTPPSLDDVFLHYTGHTIREKEISR